MLAAILTNLALPADTHDGWLPREVIDVYRRARERDYQSRDELIDDMKAMLSVVTESPTPEVAKGGVEIERSLISRRGMDVGGRASIVPFVDYGGLLADADRIRRLVWLYLAEKRRLDDEAALLLILSID